MKYKVAEPRAFEKIGKMIVNINGMELGVFLVDGRYYAWRNVCPHASAPVCEGVVQGTRLVSQVYNYEYGLDNQVLRCPWHGWEFELTSGRHLGGSRAKLRGFPVEADDTGIYVVMNDSNEKRVEANDRQEH